ncbi:MAG TPA: SRPBCC family protein [Nocardioidaceae bacterium]|nr:SRPBCC family protein [Nocardioidaceae bacterium]
MIRLERTVSVTQPVDRVYAYLADFTTTTEWDPGSIVTVLAKGDGGVGSEYHNTSKFAGRKTEITYVMKELVPNERIALRGENKSVVAHDTMELRPTATGADVLYRVEFEFQGAAKYVEPLMRLPLKKLLDDGQRGMERALAAL